MGESDLDLPEEGLIDYYYFAQDYTTPHGPRYGICIFVAGSPLFPPSETRLGYSLNTLAEQLLGARQALPSGDYLVTFRNSLPPRTSSHRTNRSSRRLRPPELESLVNAMARHDDAPFSRSPRRSRRS